MLTMKHLLITTIAAVLLVGCGTLHQSSDVEPAKPVAEGAQPQQPSRKPEALDISIQKAAYDGNIEAIKQHLAVGTDVNAKGGGGWTPLHLSVQNGKKEVSELLISEGADVNAANDNGNLGLGRTPLHFAALDGPNEIIELLIAKGADVNQKDVNGETPLDWAEETNNKEIADLLRKHGAKTGEELKAEGK